MRTRRMHPNDGRHGSRKTNQRQRGKSPVHKDCPLQDYYQNRKANELADKLFNSSANGSKLYEDFFLNKLDSLRREICQLDFELESRKIIHSQLMQELDSQILSSSIFLDHIKHWGIGYKTGVDIERNFWEKRIADLTKEKRNEKLKVWKDQLTIKEVKRDLDKEYEEMLKRAGLLK